MSCHRGASVATPSLLRVLLERVEAKNVHYRHECERPDRHGKESIDVKLHDDEAEHDGTPDEGRARDPCGHNSAPPSNGERDEREPGMLTLGPGCGAASTAIGACCGYCADSPRLPRPGLNWAAIQARCTVDRGWPRPPWASRAGRSRELIFVESDFLTTSMDMRTRERRRLGGLLSFRVRALCARSVGWRGGLATAPYEPATAPRRCRSPRGHRSRRSAYDHGRAAVVVRAPWFGPGPSTRGKQGGR